MMEGLALLAGRGNVESGVGPCNAVTHNPDTTQASHCWGRTSQPTLRLLIGQSGNHLFFHYRPGQEEI